MTDDEQLNQELVGGYRDRTKVQNNNLEMASPSYPQGALAISQAPEFRQWQIGPNDCFRPAGLTREKLPSGVYNFWEDHNGLVIQKIAVSTDELVILPDTANDRVLTSMRTFWQREDLYRKHGLLYKRGILLWGPPGGGKTATIQLLSQELIQRQDGLVIFCDIPHLAVRGIAVLRRIEPKRKIICVMEDIDELIVRYGEHALLALLDGENQVDNIVNIATTNYPSMLGARIVNRPARFDVRILVKMPSAAAREVYLRKIAVGLDNLDLINWVADTEGLSVAHLRELAAAVLCLGEDYSSVLKRLQSMRNKLNEDGVTEPVGFRG